MTYRESSPPQTKGYCESRVDLEIVWVWIGVKQVFRLNNWPFVVNLLVSMALSLVEEKQNQALASFNHLNIVWPQYKAHSLHLLHTQGMFISFIFLSEPTQISLLWPKSEVSLSQFPLLLSCLVHFLWLNVMGVNHLYICVYVCVGVCICYPRTWFKPVI